MDETPGPSRPWFAAKSHGFGSGLPIAWQGWACLAGFLAFSLVLPAIIDPRLALVVICIVAVAFVELSRRKTDKPWKWRWGGDD